MMSSTSITDSADNNSVTDPSISYTWKIPSLSNHEILVLCSVYTQNACQFIPKPLIQLISEYFTNDSFTLQDMKDAKCSESFCTGIVSIKSIKVYLKIYPNGISEVLNNFAIVVKSPPLPPQMPEISIVYKLIVNEKRETHEKKVNGDDTGIYGVSFLNGVNISEYDTFNVKLIVSKLVIHDENGTVIKDCFDKCIDNTPIPAAVPLPEMNYEWLVSNKTVLTSMKNAFADQWFSSPMFSFGKFKMALTFSPNNHGTEDSVLYFRITSFPDNINKLQLRGYFCIPETNTEYIDDNLSLYPGGELIGWPNGLLHKKQLQELDSLTFKIEFTIYDAFDENTRLIPNYIEKLSFKDNTKMINLPIAYYKWKLCDSHIIQRIHSCKNVMSLISNILTIGPFKWYLAIYPDGINKKTEGKLCFGLKLLYVPPILSKVSWRFSMSFPEMAVAKTYIATMESKVDIKGSNPWCWLGINIEKHKLKLMNEFTLNLEATLIDCWDLNDNYNNSFLDINHHKFKQITNFPCSEYIWQIEGNTLEKIKNATSVFGIFSPVFTVFGLKWCINIYPKGSSKERCNNIGIGVSCLTFWSKRMMVNAKTIIHLIETGDISQTVYCGRCVSTSWGCPVSKSKSSVIMNLDKMTISVKIQLIDVWNENENITRFMISDYNNKFNNINVSVPSEIYEWYVCNSLLNKMKTAVLGMEFKSDVFRMYGMDFVLQIYPNGKEEKQATLTNIGVTLISGLPSRNSVVCTRCAFKMMEANKRIITSGIFYDSNNCVEWKHSAGYIRLSFEEFKQLRKCTIELEMQLIAVYDNSVDITNRFVDLEKLKFKSWLENEVGLNEYYQLFINNGIDRLSIVKLIDGNKLNQIGITNIAHCARLLLQISMLNIVCT